MAFITLDDRQLKQFERSLGRLRKKALPFATKQTVNDAAFQARTEAQKIIGQRMTLRNQWTKRGVGVRKATTLTIRRQEGVVGHPERYMEDQEFGSTEHARGKHGLAIPTATSSGEGRTAFPRRRLPRKLNKLQNIELRKTRGRAKSRKHKNFLRVRAAIKTKQKFVFLDLQRSKGIFKVMGSKKNPELRMVHDISRRSVTIPKTPWLAPAMDKVQPRMPGIYRKALLAQLKRHHIFSR